jgi:hypothetical protein
VSTQAINAIKIPFFIFLPSLIKTSLEETQLIEECSARKAIVKGKMKKSPVFQPQARTACCALEQKDIAKT